MAGSYGINRGATFNPTLHAEIFVSYSESRSVVSSNFESVDVSKYLSAQLAPNSTTNPIGGIYNLKLPLDKFNKVGIYNIYIRPKQIEVAIQDVGVLSAYPNIKGIVLKTSELSSLSLENDSLSGYRIEYLDQSNIIVNNLFRIITSNNRCEPVNQNITSSNQKSIRYRFNDSSDLVFLTVTPSSASAVKPNSLPEIGRVGQKIILTNTFFNPIMVEVELTNNDIETLYTSINGNQVRTLDNGLITTYDQNNKIFNQVEHYIIKETATGKPVNEIKVNKTNIDFTQDFNTITGNI